MTRFADTGLRLLGACGLIGLVTWLVLQHRILFPMHDDWGLAVLDYAIAHPQPDGRNYGVGALLEFVGNLFFNWSGRVGSFFAICGAFKFGVELVRAVQCAVLLSIVTLTSLICIGELNRKPRSTDIAIIFLPTTVLLCLPLLVAVGGLYWFCASAIYSWGVPMLLLGVLVAQRTGTLTLLESLLLTFAALFSELLGCAAVGFALFRFLLIGMGEPQGSRGLARFAYLGMPIAAFLTCTLAPGNFARLRVTPLEEAPLIQRIAANFDASSAHLLGDSNPFLLVWCASIACWLLQPGCSTRSPWRLALGLVVLLLPAMLYATLIPTWLALALLISIHGYSLFDGFRRSGSRGTYLGSFIAALASLALVVGIAPAIAARSMLTFALLMMVPISGGFATALRVPGAQRALALALLSCCLALGILHSERIYRGYLANFQTHAENDERLRQAAIDHSLNPEAKITVEYLRLPNPMFAEVMPYDRPLIERWIKKYYQLPESASFVYPP